MKKFSLVSLSLLVIVFCCNAQNFSYGFKGGINIGTPIGKVVEEVSTFNESRDSLVVKASGSPGVGPHFGAFGRYNISKKLSIQAELLYSNKGASFVSPAVGDTNQIVEVIAGVKDTIPGVPFDMLVEGEFDNWYIDLPIQVVYHLGDHWTLLGGVQLSYLVKGKNEGLANGYIGISYDWPIVDEEFNETRFLNDFNYGMVLGTNYEFDMGVHIGIRATCDLNSIYKSDYTAVDGTYRNVYLQASIAYQFRRNRQL